jgi:hypothetical protein
MAIDPALEERVMPGNERYSAHQTVRLDHANLQLATFLARRYGVTLQHLIEALLLGCAERDGVVESTPEPEAPSRGEPSRNTPARGRIIDLSASRARRPRRFPRRSAPIPDRHDRHARIEAVLQRSKNARAMAAAACEMAGVARVRAQELKEMWRRCHSA